MHGPVPPPLNVPVEDTKGSFKWVIEDWSQIRGVAGQRTALVLSLILRSRYPHMISQRREG